VNVIKITWLDNSDVVDSIGINVQFALNICINEMSLVTLKMLINGYLDLLNRFDEYILPCASPMKHSTCDNF
jgi:hypothetical protein